MNDISHKGLQKSITKKNQVILTSYSTNSTHTLLLRILNYYSRTLAILNFIRGETKQIIIQKVESSRHLTNNEEIKTWGRRRVHSSKYISDPDIQPSLERSISLQSTFNEVAMIISMSITEILVTLWRISISLREIHENLLKKTTQEHHEENTWNFSSKKRA